MTKTILLIGATGRTGKAVLKNALQRGINVHALARTPDVLPAQDGLTVFEGSPLVESDVAKAMQGVDAVVTVLGIHRVKDSPFAKLAGSETLLTDSIKVTAKVMQQQGVKRISILSASGVGDSYGDVPWLFRMMIRLTPLGLSYRDHDGVDATIRATDLDWTLVRPVMLNDKKPLNDPLVVSYGNQPKPKMKITRDTVAGFMVDCLDDPVFIKKAPTVSQA